MDNFFSTAYTQSLLVTQFLKADTQTAEPLTKSAKPCTHSRPYFFIAKPKTGTILERNGLILTHIMVCVMLNYEFLMVFVFALF